MSPGIPTENVEYLTPANQQDQFNYMSVKDEKFNNSESGSSNVKRKNFQKATAAKQTIGFAEG